MSKKRKSKMSKKRQQELAAQYVSPYSLRTPKGRRRSSLVVILAGIALSHIWYSGVIQDALNNLPSTGPTSVQWTP